MARRDFKRDSSVTTGLIPFIVVSLVVHGLLFFLRIDVPEDTSDLVSIKYFDIPGASGNVIPEKAVPEKVMEELPKGQIVDISKPETEKKPLKSKFLSEFDSSVNKETKSDFDNVITVRDKKLRKKLSEPMPDETNDKNEDVIGLAENKTASASQEKIKKGEIKGFDGADGKYFRGSEKEKQGIINAKDNDDQEGSQVVGGHRIAKRFLPYFNGNDVVLTTPSNDFLKDIEKGDETELNTKKFIYSAYFNKIKQTISQHWTPAYVMMINDPGGHFYGRKSRYTKLIVHISANGELVKAEVDTSSGVDFLDREAINAFKTASPFSPPPKVLLTENNVLEIHFGFMVTME